jgi:voltage-gated potassium channel
MADLKSKIHFWFEDIQTPAGRALDILVVILIFIVSTIFVLKTYPLPSVLHYWLDRVENFIIVVFVIEYILRIWSAPDRIREMLKIYSIVDLVAIIPIFFAIDSYQVLRIFRALRVLRLIRFLKDSHFFYKKFSQTHLIIIRITFIIFAIIFVSSGLIFYAESRNPGSDIKTFADAVYFSIITLTTVGYGDITPKTGYGRFITVLIVLSGIIFIPFQVKELIKQFLVRDEKQIRKCAGCSHDSHDGDALFCKKCGGKLK